MSVIGKKRKSDRTPPKPRPAGEGHRQAFAPSDQQRAMVRALSVGGFPQTEICKAIRNGETGKPIDKKTLELHFRDELDMAFFETAALAVSDFTRHVTGASAVFDARGNLVREEVKSDAKRQIFFLSARLKNYGWSTRTEVTGKDGKPLPMNVAQLSDEQIDDFLARLADGDDGETETGEEPSKPADTGSPGGRGKRKKSVPKP